MGAADRGYFHENVSFFQIDRNWYWFSFKMFNQSGLNILLENHMRREYVIFYSENHIFGNAIRRCLLDKNWTFLSRISMKSPDAIVRCCHKKKAWRKWSRLFPQMDSRKAANGLFGGSAKSKRNTWLAIPSSQVSFLGWIMGLEPD